MVLSDRYRRTQENSSTKKQKYNLIKVQARNVIYISTPWYWNFLRPQRLKAETRKRKHLSTGIQQRQKTPLRVRNWGRIIGKNMAQSQGASGGAGLRGTTYVSFVCQRCYQPLRLDHSFKSLDDETLRELTGKIQQAIRPINLIFIFSQAKSLGLIWLAGILARQTSCFRLK